MPNPSSDPATHESTNCGMMNELFSVALQQSTENDHASTVDNSVVVSSENVVPSPQQNIVVSSVDMEQNFKVISSPTLVCGHTPTVLMADPLPCSSDLTVLFKKLDTNHAISKRNNPTERLQRSRERNRMHARKTRQRKKEAMQTLQQSLDELKEEQIRLRQVINEKNTANILVGLFSSNGTNGVAEDPDIEMLLRRPASEIPDASKIPELPALILPGHHNSKKAKGPNQPSSTENDLDDDAQPQHQLIPDDGIDYALLGKDRSKCTPDELDQIRRERNRMHAKRTRDRKRLLMEAMEKIIKKLEDENALLQGHLQSLGGTESTQHLVSPNLISATPPPKPDQPPSAALLNIALEKETLTETPQDRKELVNQLKCLLVAAGAFEGENCQHAVSSTMMTAVSTSAEISGESSCSEDDAPEPKRRKLSDGPYPHAIAI